MDGTGTKPLVSVIIPTYNRAHYVIGAVESALAQRDVATEIIVVDDGSTDDTRLRLGPYLDRVRYIYQANAGAGAARNTGLRAAQGEFIAFLDCDDLWEPFKLALQLSYLQAQPDVALVCTDFSGFSDEGPLGDSYITTYCPVVATKGRRFDRIFHFQDSLAFEGKMIPAFQGNVFDTVLDGYFTLTSTVVLRRSCIKPPMFFREDLPTSEDYDFYLRLARRHTFAYLDIATARYRRGHADQLGGPRYAVEMIRAWVEMAEGVRRDDPVYYASHRGHVDRIIRRWRHGLGTTLYAAGEYRAAAAVFARSLRESPWQKRPYLYLVLALVRSAAKRRTDRRHRTATA